MGLFISSDWSTHGKPSYGAIRKMLNQGWLTEEQADEWFASITEQAPSEADQSAEEPRAKDAESEEHPKWEAIYPTAH